MEAWAIDFVRAIFERNILAKLFFRIAIGKYAYREFVGMVETMNKEGLYPWMDYDLKHMEYHQESIPKIWRL